MPSTLAEVITRVRRQLNEPVASYWSDDELLDFSIAGAKDLWRDIADLKQEHYLTINDDDVYLGSGDTELTGVPVDVHKVYLIEPRDVSQTGSSSTLIFTPRDWNHADFRAARARGTIDSAGGEIFYAITGQGSPVGAPHIRTAPTVNADVLLTLSYVPTLEELVLNSIVPIPGECDNALVAWTLAYARAKEREDGAVDPGWIAIYATEKAHLLQSLGLRQYQEPTITDGMFSELW